MTRKDYIAFANALLAVRPGFADNPQGERSFQWRRDCDAIISVLAKDNPRFNLVTFKLACGLEHATPG